jgi:MurNAc alpha-1-phosphate uridylyltransferase
MDILLMLSPTVRAVGYAGPGDFTIDALGRLSRRIEKRVAPFAYAGAAIVHPRAFEGAPEGAFSFNLLFDRAIAAGRLYGMRMDGQWLHVGTPEAIHDAEMAIAASAA